jgi:sulfite reductase (NADPH) hemoprotein beta-component
VTDAIETIVDTYLGLRKDPSEIFLEAYRRVGPQPFKDALYGSAAEAA